MTTTVFITLTNTGCSICDIQFASGTRGRTNGP